jgi:hypothetical protein
MKTPDIINDNRKFSVRKKRIKSLWNDNEAVTTGRKKGGKKT